MYIYARGHCWTGADHNTVATPQNNRLTTAQQPQNNRRTTAEQPQNRPNCTWIDISHWLTEGLSPSRAASSSEK